MNSDLHTTWEFRQIARKRAILVEMVAGSREIATPSRHRGAFSLMCGSCAGGQWTVRENHDIIGTFNGPVRKWLLEHNPLSTNSFIESLKNFYPVIRTQSGHFHDIGRRTPNFLNHGQVAKQLKKAPLLKSPDKSSKKPQSSSPSSGPLIRRCPTGLPRQKKLAHAIATWSD
jgi:hypothetical protein